MSSEKPGAQRLQRLLEFVPELTSTTSLEPLLHKIVEASVELTETATSAILLLDESSGDLRFVAASSLADQLADIRVPIDGSIAGAALTSGKPLIVPNIRADRRHYKAVDQHIDVETRSLLAVPLQYKDRRIGVLEAQNKRDNTEFDQEDVDTLTLLAAQAAVAIENARLVEALQESRDRLEQRVEERTAELSKANTELKQQVAERRRAEEALRQQTIDLQARNEELDAFSHTVAHDLRGPLGNVVGFSETLEEFYSAMTREMQSRSLHMISQSGRKMINIIDELLLLAGLRGTDAEIGPFETGQVVREALGRLDYLAEQTGAQIVVPETWPAVRGYGPWVEEVWVNYLSNAFKYGGQPPRAELGATMEADAMVRFWVRDNGPGLTPEEQERLFTPFTRLDQVTAKGHGLGLSIARRIVEKLGGRVAIESQAGQGSVFSFTLPAAR